MKLESQLETYTIDKTSDSFWIRWNWRSCKKKKDGITEEKYFVSLDFKLIKLVLMLPIATPIVEKAFSSMNNVKNQLTS